MRAFPSISYPTPRSWTASIADYFRSGWAFFVPYLATYLVYAGLDWPVNPPGATVSTQSSFGPPALLHVYWFLHGVHVICAAVVLRRIARNLQGRQGSRLFVRSLPWILLGLIFWIPGAYLEFPADPWEHLRRINEWAWHESVEQHTYWTKSTYFLAYSVIGKALSFSSQITYLDLFQTATGLLLSWQYYRLAQVTGLPRSAAMLAAITHVLLAGNSVFGFHRYYGVASTEVAHIGAVAFIRSVIALSSHRTGSSSIPRFGFYVRLVAGALLLTLIVSFSHVQGIGIMLLGGSAVLCWRMVKWRFFAAYWMLVVAGALSVAVVVWFPCNATLRDRLIESGWMTRWSGLNILSPGSPAGIRTIAILGVFGAIELAAAGWLFVSKNHVVGWLCLFPIVALSLPVVAIPLVTFLTAKGELEILVFHRFLFAIPSGLALTTICWSAWCRITKAYKSGYSPPFVSPGIRSALPFGAVTAAMFALILVPPGAPYFNRLWHIFVIPAADLEMVHVRDALDEKPARPGTAAPLLLGSRGPSFVAAAGGKSNNSPLAGRLIHTLHPIEYLPVFKSRLNALQPEAGADLIVISPVAMYSPLSFAGYLSGHWLPQENALDNTQPSIRPFGSRWQISPQMNAPAKLVSLEPEIFVPLLNKTD